MLASVSVPWASVLQTIRTPASAASLAWCSFRSRRFGIAVDLHHRPGPRRRLGDPLDVDPVGLAPQQQPAGEVPDAVDQRVLHRGDDPLGHRLLGDGERRCGRCRSPSRARRAARPGSRAHPSVPMLTSEPASSRNPRGADSFQARISSIRFASCLGLTSLPNPWRGGVVGDREVGVAALPRGLRHLLERVAAVRERRVAVEVAADVVDGDQLGELAGVAGLDLAPALAQLGLDVGEAEQLVDARLLGEAVDLLALRSSATPCSLTERPRGERPLAELRRCARRSR